MFKVIEIMLQLFLVSIFAAVSLFSLPFTLLELLERKKDEAGAASTSRYHMPDLKSEALWGGIALVSWALFLGVGMETTNLKALATGIGMAVGIFPA